MCVLFFDRVEPNDTMYHGVLNPSLLPQIDDVGMFCDCTDRLPRACSKNMAVKPCEQKVNELRGIAFYF